MWLTKSSPPTLAVQVVLGVRVPVNVTQLVYRIYPREQPPSEYRVIDLGAAVNCIAKVLLELTPNKVLLGRENMLRLAFVAGDVGAANLVAQIDTVGAPIVVARFGTVHDASRNIGQTAVDRMPSWFEYFAENAK